MSSSLQPRRTAPSSSSSGNRAVPSTSTSSSARRARAATLLSSTKASKKRRYVDIVNTCRNPFCGAALDNKTQRYCDGNKFCQLRRGLELLCAWPKAPPDDHDNDAPLVPSSASSAPASAVPVASGTTSTATASSSSSASASASGAMSGEKRPRSSEEPTTVTTSTGSKKPRVLQRHASAESLSTPLSSMHSTASAPTTPRGAVGATPPVTPTAGASTTTAQQVKATTIDVVPLGVGNRTGGGGRYVRSGNRAEINSSTMVRPPSFSRFPTTTSTSSTTSTTTGDMPPVHTNAPSLGTTPPVFVPPPHPPFGPTASVSSAPPSRILSRANSLPVTTTNRSRDPRVRAAANATATATAATANGDTNAPVRKTMSAADYLNMNRNKDASSAAASVPVSSSSTGLASARAPEPHRPPSSTYHGAPPSSTIDFSGSHGQDASMRPLRRAQSDTTAHATPYDGATKSDRYLSYRPDGYAQEPPSNRASDYRYDNYGSNNAYPPQSANSNHFDNRNARNAYDLSVATTSSSSHHSAVGSNYASGSDAYDRKSSHHSNDHDLSNSRGSSTGTTPYRSGQQDSATAAQPLRESSRNSTPRVSRAETLFGSLLRPKFSHCDPFLKLILMRMASFLPEERVGIKAVTYKTTTKRKLHFYLDYAKRVEECCGRLAKLTVNDGVAMLTIAGREWIAIEGTSTMVLYQQILERLHDESVRWRSLIMELKSIHSAEKRTRNGGAINGVSFLKFWSAMKAWDTGDASDLDFQSSLTVGNNRFHWVFSVGNVEVGSGSAAGKVDAFKEATSSAFGFLDALTILAPEEKHRVAQVDGVGHPSGSSRPSSSSSSRPGSGDASTRRATVPSSSSSRTTSSPRTNGSSTDRSSIATSTSTSTETTSSSNRTNGASTIASHRGNGTSTDRSSAMSTSSTTPTSSSTHANEASNARITGGARRSFAVRRPRASTERIVDAPPAAERSMSDDEESMSISSIDEHASDQTTAKPVTIPIAPSVASTTSSSSSTTTVARSTPVAAAAPTSSASASTPSSASASASAPAPAPSACRFCENMQRLRPGALCVKCARQARANP